MAEELNMHFSSVFTREDTSSLPVPETKFNGSEGERLGQLVVTPDVVVDSNGSARASRPPSSAGLRSVEAPGQQCHRKVVNVMSISTYCNKNITGIAYD